MTNSDFQADSVNLPHPHAVAIDKLCDELNCSPHGLSGAEAESRLEKYGRNELPRLKPASFAVVFVRQFASPLIYILLAAAIISLVLQEWSDAIFISIVLLINAIIGSIQEHSAQRAATALNALVTTRCRVIRNGDAYEIDSERVVPGDIVLLESGDRIPADIRLLSSLDLELDESLLTGESAAVLKDPKSVLPVETTLGDRSNMVFAGSMVNRGRGRGIAFATALNTELGEIAADVLNKPPTKAPLLVRMERFSRRVAIMVGVAATIMAVVSLFRGMPASEIFFLAVALAVSAIPEGLPVALTVALAIGMRRMSRRNVIVRRLLAVEALGSCTYIATDKTGTLTVNKLTARKLVLPNGENWPVSGEGLSPVGKISFANNEITEQRNSLLKRMCHAAALANDGFIGHLDGGWTQHGDAVDIALLVMARKAGYVKADLANIYQEISIIPFESERMFSASLNIVNGSQHAFVKGAMERVLPMCSHMSSLNSDTEDIEINPEKLITLTRELAEQGNRVVALASGNISLSSNEVFSQEHLHGLTLLGLACMVDPLRPEARESIARCHDAGIQVAMVTGDHPATALAVAKELGLASDISDIVTGPQLKRVSTKNELDTLTREAKVFARVEPRQKLDIVQSLQRNGHFVAVSGDGANDAPALKAAQVGVAMGKSGTDVARETADLIITDDNFSSIVSGIEEGRVAYANVRKVIFLLISTGAAEIVLFTLALLTNQPLPLLAVQLLWLNQ